MWIFFVCNTIAGCTFHFGRHIELQVRKNSKNDVTIWNLNLGVIYLYHILEVFVTYFYDNRNFSTTYTNYKFNFRTPFLLCFSQNEHSHNGLTEVKDFDWESWYSEPADFCVDLFSPVDWLWSSSSTYTSFVIFYKQSIQLHDLRFIVYAYKNQNSL